jgi:hypothetical protein
MKPTTALLTPVLEATELVDDAVRLLLLLPAKHQGVLLLLLLLSDGQGVRHAPLYNVSCGSR